MIKVLLLLIVIAALGCRDRGDSPPASESNIDAARNFIRAALDGRFNDARKFMVQDTKNTDYMNVVERTFKNLDQQTKDGYRTSTIRIIGIQNLNDSVSTVIYANSFKNDPDTLKVMRIAQEWLVDFKYLYEHDFDTLRTTTDSLP